MKCLNLTLALLGLSLASCASQMNVTRTVRFKDDVTMITMDGKETSINAGDSMPLPTEPFQISGYGQTGVLVVPLNSSGGSTDIKLNKVQNSKDPEFNRELNTRLNQVIEKVVTAQRALSNRQANEALQIIAGLQNTYVGLTYLDFLKASTYVLLGEREKARQAIETALAAFPDNVAGKQLLESLSRGR